MQRPQRRRYQSSHQDGKPQSQQPARRNDSSLQRCCSRCPGRPSEIRAGPALPRREEMHFRQFGRFGERRQRLPHPLLLLLLLRADTSNQQWQPSRSCRLHQKGARDIHLHPSGEDNPKANTPVRAQFLPGVNDSESHTGSVASGRYHHSGINCTGHVSSDTCHSLRLVPPCSGKHREIQPQHLGQR